MEKQVRVIMMPTEDKAFVYVGLLKKTGNLLYNPNNSPLHEDLIQDDNYVPCHIYITVIEDIERGDIMMTHEGIETAGYDGYTFDKGDEFCRKIIATTDKYVRDVTTIGVDGTSMWRKFPDLQQDFIKAFVESGGREINWEIECEMDKINASKPHNFILHVPKIDQNNCVIIKSMKKQVKLSKRELSVLRLMKQGLKNAEIADSLDISQKTISTYKLRAKTKMGMEPTDNDYIVVVRALNLKLIK